MCRQYLISERTKSRAQKKFKWDANTGLNAASQRGFASMFILKTSASSSPSARTVTSVSSFTLRLHASLEIPAHEWIALTSTTAAIGPKTNWASWSLGFWWLPKEWCRTLQCSLTISMQTHQCQSPQKKNQRHNSRRICNKKNHQIPICSEVDSSKGVKVIDSGARKTGPSQSLY